MLIVINHHNGVPAYRQIMDQVRLQIASGVLKPDDELPSTRSLSAELSLNPMTISKAYALLERDGILERRRGQTLMVKAVEAAHAHGQKTEQLRQSLAPAVTVARQLGIPPAQAAKLFRELLDRSAH